MNNKKIITALFGGFSLLLIYILIISENRFPIPFAWRFVFSALIGILMGILIFKLWEVFCRKHITLNLILTILSIFITIGLAVLPINDKNIKHGLKAHYGKDNHIDIGKHFEDENADNHCSIFILDKTMNTGYNPQFLSSLQSKYDSYIRNITVDSVYKDFPKKKKDISYVDFCRAKLCADLLYLHNKRVVGKFHVYTFDTDTKPVSIESINDYVGDIADIENIRNVIMNLPLDTIVINKETESDFCDFYDKMPQQTLGSDKYEFNQYTIYAYSDFVHDKKKHQNYNENHFESEKIRINNAQKNLYNCNVVQNIFKVPSSIENIKSTTNLIEYILDTVTTKDLLFYKNIISVNNLPQISDKPHEKYHKIKYIEDLIVYSPIFDNQCFPNLKFSNDRFWVKLKKGTILDDNQELKLNTKDGKENINDKTFIKIKETICPILIKGSCPTDNQIIYLDIADEKGTHCLVRLVIKQPYPIVCKYLLPIFCFLSAFFLSILLCIGIWKNKNQ